MRNMDTSIGQLATALSGRSVGSLPADTTPNPKGNQNNPQCKAVTLRNGKELTEIIPDNKLSVELGTEKKVNFELNEQRHGEADDMEENENLEEKKSDRKKKLSESDSRLEKRDTLPPPPFPQRLRKSKLDQQFQKFLEIFKKLEINIPFAEALEQMPSYVKFMKDILSKKRRFGDCETVALTQECSAILQKKLPPKLKDPGSFTIPCSIGYEFEGRALCDLGASINLMSYSIYRKLGLGEVNRTSLTLQLADRSLAFPKGIVEDVLVKVEKFIFPADFVILEMEEDRDVPIILGRPFLATGRTLIDVHKGELTMRVNDEQVTFNVLKAMKFPQRENENLEEVNAISMINFEEFKILEDEFEEFLALTTDLDDSLEEEMNRSDYSSDDMLKDADFYFGVKESTDFEIKSIIQILLEKIVLTPTIVTLHS